MKSQKPMMVDFIFFGACEYANSSPVMETSTSATVMMR